MSYNLLLDTNFNKINKHWKLTNCEYKNGYLIGNSTIYSIEQEIILPNPTKIYFSMEYICFDENIKAIYCGIFTNNGKLEASKKKAKLRKRKRLSVIDSVKTEKVKVMFIVESNTPNTKIYIDSPLLIDLTYQNKDFWPKWMLDKIFDYRYGYDYINLYGASEILLSNEDFNSPYTITEQGKIGILATIKETDWFKINYQFVPNKIYLVKLDYEQINEYGEIYLKYNEDISTNIDKEQLYLLFKGDETGELKLYLQNEEQLPYLVNLKHILIVDATNLKIDGDDISHLPFI